MYSIIYTKWFLDLHPDFSFNRLEMQQNTVYRVILASGNFGGFAMK